MAEIHILKKSSRGIAICSKCGKEIIRGERYNKATPFRKESIIRCLLCGLKPYETSGSSYIRTAGDLVYKWKIKYKVNESIIDTILLEIDNIRGELDYNLNCIPEQFQDYSILQDRIDSLDDCISELEAIDISDYDDKDSLISDIDAALACIQLR